MAAYLDEMNLRALWGLATCNMAGDSGDFGETGEVKHEMIVVL